MYSMTTFKYISSPFTELNANNTYLVSVSVECMLEVDYVRVVQLLHDLELPIFVPLVLVDFLDSHDLTGLRNTRLEYNSKGAIPNDPIRIIGEGRPLKVAG
jgi:hypothetical protein